MEFEFSNTEVLSEDVRNVVYFLQSSKKLQLLESYLPADLKKYIRVHVAFATDNDIQLLNRLYRQMDKPTDVLSFEIHEDVFLGELYISVTEVQKNSKFFGSDFLHEFFEVIVHGVLHLMGYDHSEEMFGIQHKIRDSIFNEYQTYSRAR